LLSRAVLELNVLPDRNPLFVVLSDGSIRNGYTIKILNKRYQVRRYQLSVAGLAGARVKVIGYGDTQKPIIDVIPDALRALKVYVTLAPGTTASSRAAISDFHFVVKDLDDNEQTQRAARFRRPAR
jgi:polyferredoxin